MNKISIPFFKLIIIQIFVRIDKKNEVIPWISPLMLFLGLLNWFAGKWRFSSGKSVKSYSAVGNTYGIILVIMRGNRMRTEMWMVKTGTRPSWGTRLDASPIILQHNSCLPSGHVLKSWMRLNFKVGNLFARKELQTLKLWHDYYTLHFSRFAASRRAFKENRNT